MMPFSHHAATRLVMLFGLAALLACTNAGCQCCAWSERYMDCVDHVSDHEGNAQVCYRPWYDLTRIGRVNWPWACCQKCPPPGFVYDTPVTYQVMSRIHAEEQGFDAGPAAPAPPPLLPGDIWSQPQLDTPPEDDDVGAYPLGPLFDSESTPVPPSPEPVEEDPVESLPSELETPPLPLDSNFEVREPTLAPPRLPVSSEIDALDSRNADWANAAGVVSLFGDAAGPSSGIRMNQLDHSEYGLIKLDSWLSDANVSNTSTELPATTSAANDYESRTNVSPSAGVQAEGSLQSTHRAQWWEAAPPPNPVSNTTPTQSPSTQTADDVFGASPFAEWQSATE